MKRFNSPIGTMVEVVDGNYVSFIEHEAAMKHKSSFEAHMKSHDLYGERASAIARIFRKENVIPHNAYFIGIGGLTTDHTAVYLQFEENHGNHTGTFAIKVPLSLFDHSESSDVVVAARQHKAAELERIGKEQQEAAAKQEKEERAKLAELLAKYPGADKA